MEPKAIVELMDLYGPMTIADFGSGPGFFTMPIAEKISSEGTVYAFDIQKGPLRVLRRKAEERQLHNIRTIAADLEKPQGTHLKDASVDRIIAAQILFQAENPLLILTEAFRILKKHGTLIIVEWDTEPIGLFGPKHEYRIPKNKLLEFLLSRGFTISRTLQVSGHHHAILCKK